jgi:D-alanyl-lipoteichoic acid acyltransferase DltB (MBOAT superfamily)
LAILTLFGLLAALLGTGIWHGLSWLALAIPLAVGLRFSLRPRHRIPRRVIPLDVRK